MPEANQVDDIKLPSPADDEQSLFDRAIAAERLWRQHVETVWSQSVPGTPEFDRSDVENSVLCDGYHVLFRAFCDFALANPSLEILAKVVVLWRLRCWDDEESLGLMTDDFEARTIVRLSDILTRIKH